MASCLVRFLASHVRERPGSCCGSLAWAGGLSCTGSSMPFDHTTTATSGRARRRCVDLLRRQMPPRTRSKLELCTRTGAMRRSISLPYHTPSTTHQAPNTTHHTPSYTLHTTHHATLHHTPPHFSGVVLSTDGSTRKRQQMLPCKIPFDAATCVGTLDESAVWRMGQPRAYNECATCVGYEVRP